MARDGIGRPRVLDPRRRLRRHRRRAEAARATPTSCSSTSTTTTRSSRCCTSSRPACSRQRPSATRSATSSHDQDNARVHKATSTAIDLEAREVRFARDGAARLRLPRARARRRGQLLRRRGRGGARVPAVHAARRRAAEEPRARALGGGRPRPGADRGRRAERRRRRRRADRRRDARARWPSSTAATSPRTTRDVPQEQARDHPRRGGPGALLDVQAEPPRVHARRRSRSARSRS